MSDKNNHKKHFSLTDITLALLRFAPRLPRFIFTLAQLAWARKTQRGSVGYFLQRAAARHADAIFLKYEDESYTYGEFNQWVNQLAAYLQQRGVQPGDCVALWFPNSPAQLAWALAVCKLGAIAGMLNTKQTAQPFLHSLEVMHPRLLINAEPLPTLDFPHQKGQPTLTSPTSESGLPFLGVVAAAEVPRDATRSWPDPKETEAITLGATAFYVMTSGTTGLPKAAAMTHLRWYKAGIAFGRMALNLKQRKDTMYCALPMYHNTALSIALSASIMTGSTLALAPRFSASHFWQDCQRHRATTFVYVGELCRYLLQQPAQANEQNNRIRAVLGNGLRAEIWDEFQHRFGIHRICELYGASEGNVGFVNVFNLKRTVGFSPMRYTIVRFDTDHEEPLKDANGKLVKVERGEVGLLLTEVSEKAPFDGYTNNPEANQRKLFKNVFKPGDCWFNTGDLVRHQGYRHIAFIDRVGDTFRWKSENVATTEVESQLSRCKEVLNAVVYGVKIPNTEGRAGMASLVLKQGQQFNPQTFYDFVRKQLPDYARPLFIRLQQAHEMTTTFKVRKQQLKRESYELQNIKDPLFVFVNEQQGYQPLNEEILQRIHHGQHRF